MSDLGERITPYVNGTTTVVLDDLVRSMVSTTTNDPSLLSLRVSFLSQELVIITPPVHGLLQGLRL